MSVDTLELFRVALERIAKYDSPAYLRRQSERQYGLDYAEALEMAYENIRDEARSVLRRRPRRKTPPVQATKEPSTGAGSLE